MIKRIHSTLFQVENIENTTDFYKNLGFQIEKSDIAMRIIWGDYRLAFKQDSKDKNFDNTSHGVGIYTYFEVENIEKFYQNIKNRGIEVENKPVKQPWGKIELEITDPDGYHLVFFENI
jgi:uncharacterized glyoxalase superfamily protein PhnB